MRCLCFACLPACLCSLWGVRLAWATSSSGGPQTRLPGWRWWKSCCGVCRRGGGSSPPGGTLQVR